MSWTKNLLPKLIEKLETAKGGIFHVLLGKKGHGGPSGPQKLELRDEMGEREEWQFREQEWSSISSSSFEDGDDDDGITWEHGQSGWSDGKGTPNHVTQMKMMEITRMKTMRIFEVILHLHRKT